MSDLQIIEGPGDRQSLTMLLPGDKLYVVGFPYGFSAYGPSQPSPVVLTRFVAATKIADRNQQILLESAGAPGMSGGPVFLERESAIALRGMYTGLIYPDHVVGQNDRHTALGTCSDLHIHLQKALPFVQQPSES